MEWAVVVLCALVAAAMVARPWRRSSTRVDANEVETERALVAALMEERRQILAELSELDDDTAAGRIASDDRQAGRRALAPRLRRVTEGLRENGAGAKGGNVQRGDS